MERETPALAAVADLPDEGDTPTSQPWWQRLPRWADALIEFLATISLAVFFTLVFQGGVEGLHDWIPAVPEIHFWDAMIVLALLAAVVLVTSYVILSVRSMFTLTVKHKNKGTLNITVNGQMVQVDQ